MPHNKTPYELLHGSGPDWLFDIDLLTKSMNYEPVTAGNQTNKNVGIKDNTQKYILLPLVYDSPKSSKDVARDSPFNLEAFSNSDYVGASLDRKSTTRGVIDPKPDA
ncbi:hypothetical protein Tco_0952705 [Tanacetum coccineum]|uniref:Uncharacterized protein n=1 Tax=Tanacetum coccineum TaxID=301880 RepID=A0ABQ5DY35_9ASTR